MFLLRVLKDNRTIGLAGVVILGLAIFMRSFIQGANPEGSSILMDYSGMPFYELIFGAIYNRPILNRIIALVILMLISYMVIRISVRYVLWQFRSLMPAIFLILFSMALPETQQVSPALLGSVFYLLCFAILFDLHDKPPNTSTIFYASMVLVMGSMFYLKLIWFLPLIWISLFTLRTVNWRELVYPVLAYLLMGLFLLTWYWGIQDNISGLNSLIRENLAFSGSFKAYHFSTYLYYGYFMLLVAVASLDMINRFQARKTATQEIYQVLFYMFLAGILFYLLIVRFEPTVLVYIAIPVSYILTYYFHREKNHWMHELAIWVLMGLLIFAQLMA